MPLLDLHRLGQYRTRPVHVFEPVAGRRDGKQVRADLGKQVARQPNALVARAAARRHTITPTILG